MLEDFLRFLRRHQVALHLAVKSQRNDEQNHNNRLKYTIKSRHIRPKANRGNLVDRADPGFLDMKAQHNLCRDTQENNNRLQLFSLFYACAVYLLWRVARSHPVVHDDALVARVPLVVLLMPLGAHLVQAFLLVR